MSSILPTRAATSTLAIVVHGADALDQLVASPALAGEGVNLLSAASVIGALLALRGEKRPG